MLVPEMVPTDVYILEINPNPFCFFYNRSNGRADFVHIYELLLEKYVERCADGP